MLSDLSRKMPGEVLPGRRIAGGRADQRQDSSGVEEPGMHSHARVEIKAVPQALQLVDPLGEISPSLLPLPGLVPA